MPYGHARKKRVKRTFSKYNGLNLKIPYNYNFFINSIQFVNDVRFSVDTLDLHHILNSEKMYREWQ